MGDFKIALYFISGMVALGLVSALICTGIAGSADAREHKQQIECIEVGGSMVDGGCVLKESVE